MWDLKCIAAALCFLTSNILFIVHNTLMMKENQSSTDSNKENSSMNRAGFNWSGWKNLDPTYIQHQWKLRIDTRATMICAALFGAVAWFWLMVPIIQSAWVLSRGGKRLVGPHMLLAALAVFGSIIELLARLLIVGMTNSSIWLAKDFNLDDWDTEGDGTGWRVLEMIHIVTRGMLIWIDAFEALALWGIVVVLFYSIETEPKFKTSRSSSIPINHSEREDGADAAYGVGAATHGVAENALISSPPPLALAAETPRVPIKPTFSKCFAWYGLFVGSLAVVDFLADVLRFVDWRLFGRIAMTTNAMLGVIFLPIWLLCLARQLPAATERFEREERRAAILSCGGEDEVTLLKGDGTEIS